jgi:hypothetical protein
MYENTLFRVLPDYIKSSVLKKENRLKSWKYGYNKQHDIVVISKTGKIGEIYEIQNLKIALPLLEDSYQRNPKKELQYWEQLEFPKELSKIKNVFDWNKYPDTFKEKWFDYIDEEFRRFLAALQFEAQCKLSYLFETRPQTARRQCSSERQRRDQLPSGHACSFRGERIELRRRGDSELHAQLLQPHRRLARPAGA